MYVFNLNDYFSDNFHFLLKMAAEANQDLAQQELVTELEMLQNINSERFVQKRVFDPSPLFPFKN